jgi:glycosyltransferase 2 family protein
MDVEMPAAPPTRIRWYRVAIPILLGLAATGWLLWQRFDIAQFRAIQWTGRTWAWIGCAFALLLARHLFYTLRIHTLSGGIFGWRRSLLWIVLWEFTCTLAPTSKGGPFAMLFVLRRDGLPTARTTMLVFYTILCDSGFFVLLLPILLAIWGPLMLYPGMTSYADVHLASGAFFVTYSIMVTYWLALAGLLLLRPQAARTVLRRVAGWLWRERWRERLIRLGDEFVVAAEDMRGQPASVHLRVVMGTIGAWTCKFLMINALLLAVVPDMAFDGHTQMFIYARLVAMFIIMSFSPTPGGAGLAELALVQFTADIAPAGQALVVALLWRGMAYYGYLLAGSIILPRWWAGGKPRVVQGADHRG